MTLPPLFLAYLVADLLFCVGAGLLLWALIYYARRKS